MRQRFGATILMLAVASGCNSRKPDANGAHAAGAQTPLQSSTSIAAAPEVEQRLSFGSWHPTNPDGNIPDKHSRFQIAADHYASGRLVLTIDTVSPRVWSEGGEST